MLPFPTSTLPDVNSPYFLIQIFCLFLPPSSHPGDLGMGRAAPSAQGGNSEPFSWPGNEEQQQEQPGTSPGARGGAGECLAWLQPLVSPFLWLL